MTRTLARLALRAYPRRWRERYADEMLALVDDTGIGWLGVFDLASGAFGEQVRQLCDRTFGRWAARAERFVDGSGRALLWVAAGYGLWAFGERMAVLAAGNGYGLSDWLGLVAWTVLIVGLIRLFKVRRDIAWVRHRNEPPPTPGIGYVEASCWMACLVPIGAASTVTSEARVQLLVWSLWLTIGVAETVRRGPTALCELQRALRKAGPTRRSVLGLNEPDLPMDLRQ